MKLLLLFALLVLPGGVWAQQSDLPDGDLTAKIGPESARLAVKGGGPHLRFIERTAGIDQPLEATLNFYGGPVIVEATFDDEQDDDTISITLEWGSAAGGEQMMFLAKRSPTDRRAYRTEEFYIMPESSDAHPEP